MGDDKRCEQATSIKLMEDAIIANLDTIGRDMQRWEKLLLKIQCKIYKGHWSCCKFSDRSLISMNCHKSKIRYAR